MSTDILIRQERIETFLKARLATRFFQTGNGKSRKGFLCMTDLPLVEHLTILFLGDVRSSIDDILIVRSCSVLDYCYFDSCSLKVFCVVTRDVDGLHCHDQWYKVFEMILPFDYCH